jgi:tetratricopeptide (TPR) repeat protein
MENMEQVKVYYDKVINGKNKDKGNSLLGGYYFKNRDFNKALSYYKLIETPTQSDTYYKLGYSLFEVAQTLNETEKTKMLNDAKTNFKKLIGTSLNSEGIYYTALLDFRGKKYKEVIKDLKNYNPSKMKKEYRNNIEIFLGKSYYEMKNYGKARTHYENTYLKTGSKSDLYQLILVNNRLGDTKDIEKRFSEYKKKFSTDVLYRQKIYLLVGNTYYKNGNLEGAKTIYKEYLNSYDDPKISENYITILVAGGEYKELVTYLTPQPKTPENRYLMGIALLGLTEYDKAIKEFNGVISAKNSTAIEKEKATYNLVKTYFASKNYIETIKSAKKYLGIEEYKKYPLEVLDLQGLANFRLEKYQVARDIFTELGKTPKYKEYSEFQIAETYYNEGKYDEAIKSYKKLYEENKEGKYASKSLYWVINIYYTEEKYKEVIDNSKIFKIEYPKSGYLNDVNFYKADSFFKLNDVKNAAKTYIEVYQTTGDEKLKNQSAEKLTTLYYNVADYKNANIWKDKIADKDEKTYFTALIYEKQKKIDLAREEYKKLLKSKKYGSKSNYNLATSYYREKKYDDAKIYYENILEIENGPYKDTATYQIGQIYFLQKNYSKALRNFMKIDLLYEESTFREAAKLKISNIYELQKETEKAKKSYEEFYKLYPESKYRGLILEKLIVLNLNEDKKEEAKKYYTELLVVNKDVAKTYESYFK